MKTIALLPVLIAVTVPALAQTAAPAAAVPAAATPAVAPTATPDPRDKVICRTETPIGTMIGGHKECHTKRQWDDLASDSRRNTELQTRYSSGVTR